MSDIILKVQSMNKYYTIKSNQINILNDINFEVSKGESVSLIGASGSGKTTLLTLCAGLDEQSSGNIQLMGKSLGDMTENEKAVLRLAHIGFVFQNFQLINSHSVLDNVLLPLHLKGEFGRDKDAYDMLYNVGLEGKENRYPNELSGGEQQRVAIARAFVNKPTILFADEPTGNLDFETGAKIEELLFALNKEKGTTLILVTHDQTLAAKTDRQLKLHQGVLV